MTLQDPTPSAYLPCGALLIFTKPNLNKHQKFIFIKNIRWIEALFFINHHLLPLDDLRYQYSN